jgi:hypothetical protein
VPKVKRLRERGIVSPFSPVSVRKSSLAGERRLEIALLGMHA